MRKNSAKKVLILHSDVAADASEDELDCLKQAAAIADALPMLGYEPILMPFGLDLSKNIELLRLANPHVVFNLVESVGGAGSLIHIAPALLDLLHIPYTGCRTEAIFATSNKPMSKRILRDVGIATPAWMTEDGILTGAAATNTFIIKAIWEEASVGLDENSIIKSADKADILPAIQRRGKQLGVPCFAEAYVDGREFNVALLSTDAGITLLPPAEMLFLNYPPEKLKILDYRAKWVNNSFEYDNTKRSLDILPGDAELMEKLKQIAFACWQKFGLRGYARVDFRVDENRQPFVLEINANPCLSPDAGFAAALERANITYEKTIDYLIDDALK